VAWGINNSGQIVGYYGDNGTNPSGAHGFLATPISETPLPATLPLFASGLGALGVLGWRRKRKVQATA